MEQATEDRSRRLLRLGLGALGVAAGWLVLCAAFGSQSASAEEAAPPSDTPGATALLGSVSDILDSTASAVSAVADVADLVPDSGVVAGVSEPLAPVADAVAEVLPEPVADVVATIPQVTDAVGEVATADPASTVVEPVADVVDDVVAALPVVPDVVGSAPAGTVTAPVAGAVDAVLGGVDGIVSPVVHDVIAPIVGDAGGLLPGLPGAPGLPAGPSGAGSAPDAGAGVPTGPRDGAGVGSGPGAGALGPNGFSAPGGAVFSDASRASVWGEWGGPGLPNEGAAEVGAAAEWGLVPGAGGSPGGAGPFAPGGGPMGLPAPGSPSTGQAGGTGAFGSGASSAFADLGGGTAFAATLVGARGTASDDDLPSSPIHDTDTSPD